MPEALHRKYRPKSFGEFLGQEENIELLQNAAKTGVLGQAYLFYGPRGTGKTSTARLIAKLLNCEKRALDPKFRILGEPCNVCASCREIDAGASFDVVEIDAASNRGIDEIRNLKEAIRSAPASGRRRVYIIDEAHMLTGAAANALLKTLEEPPAHAAFILATTEAEKLPATITSRTQRFLFKKIPKTKIMEKLKAVARAEKIDLEPAALELIAAAAEGSFRDAESLLDQVSALGGKITLAATERLIGRAGLARVERMAELILNRDRQSALQYLEELSAEGQNLTQFTKDLVHYLRKIMTLALNPDLEKHFELELTREELARLKKLTPLAAPERLADLIRGLIRAYGEMRYSPFALVPLEIFLAEKLT